MSLPGESSNLAVILEISRHTESRLISNVLLGDFPGGSDGEESTCNAGDLGSISESTRSPGTLSLFPSQEFSKSTLLEHHLRDLVAPPLRISASRGLVGAQEFEFLVAHVVKNLPAIAGDPGLIPGSGRCPGAGNGYLLQCSCLENPMDR